MKIFKSNKTEKLSKFLLSSYGAELSYSMLMKLFRRKDIKVNGKRVNKDLTLMGGDTVEVYYDGNKAIITPVFEREGVFVFNKPPTLTSEDFEVEINKNYKGLKLCHRLDRNTSGLLVLASGKALDEMLLAFKERTVDKFYRAEVYGKLKDKKATLTAYLVKNEETSTVKIFNEKVNGSVKIVTEYEVIKEFEETSILSVKLITGKTHQIRAHLAHIGHFIIGDGKYGDNEINKKFKAKRQNLTAYKLKFNFRKESCLSSLNGIEITIDE